MRCNGSGMLNDDKLAKVRPQPHPGSRNFRGSHKLVLGVEITKMQLTPRKINVTKTLIIAALRQGAICLITV